MRNLLQPRISIVGNGSRDIAVVAGIVNAPGDWAALAHHTNATLHIAENPFRLLGKKDKYPEDWQHQWREMLVRWIVGYRTAIAHSAGGAHLLAIEQWADLDKAILINPPTRETFSVLNGTQTSPDLTIDSDPTLRAIDSLLYALRGDMRDEMYKMMRCEHYQHYGANLRNIIKHESPVKTGVTTELKTALVQATRAQLYMMIGMEDPWEDPLRRRQILGEKPKVHITEMPGGHFLHREHPEMVAQIIND